MGYLSGDRRRYAGVFQYSRVVAKKLTVLLLRWLFSVLRRDRVDDGLRAGYDR